MRAVLDHLGDADVALPHALGYDQPLAAAYRTSLAPVIDELLANDLRAPADLYARVRVARVVEADLPHLESLRNLNTPEEYDAARAEAPT